MKHWLVIVAIALLAGAVISRADIIYCSTNFVLGQVWVPEPDELFSLDMDTNGTIDFSLSANSYYFSGISSESQNRYLIHPSTPPNIGGVVAALDAAYMIGLHPEGPTEEWFGIDDWGTFIRVLDTGESGEFYEHRGYVGLEFNAEYGTHYGWLEIEGLTHSSSIQIYGWAYESTPGVGIVAGAVPEPSSSILIIVGAIGVWSLRKNIGSPASKHTQR